MPVELSVPAIFWPTSADLPVPVTQTRPGQPSSSSTACEEALVEPVGDVLQRRRLGADDFPGVGEPIELGARQRRIEEVKGHARILALPSFLSLHDFGSLTITWASEKQRPLGSQKPGFSEETGFLGTALFIDRQEADAPMIPRRRTGESEQDRQDIVGQVSNLPRLWWWPGRTPKPRCGQDRGLRRGFWREFPFCVGTGFVMKVVITLRVMSQGRVTRSVTSTFTAFHYKAVVVSEGEETNLVDVEWHSAADVHGRPITRAELIRNKKECSHEAEHSQRRHPR